MASQQVERFLFALLRVPLLDHWGIALFFEFDDLFPAFVEVHVEENQLL